MFGKILLLPKPEKRIKRKKCSILLATKSVKITRNLIQKANHLQVTQNKEVSTALSDRTLLGVLMMISFCAVAPLLDVSAKLATDEIPIGQITAIRFLIPVFLMVPLIWGLGHNFLIMPNFRQSVGSVQYSAVFSGGGPP